MLSANDVLAHLADYVLGNANLDEFEDWLVSNSWNVHQASSENVQRLVFEIESRLSEHSGGYVEEDVLRRALARLANRIDLNIGDSQPILHVSTAGSSQGPILPVEVGIGSADIQPSVAYV